MRVLVTGGTGYLGAAIVRALAAAGHEPVVFARSAARSGLPGRLVDGDVRDRDAVVRAVQRADAICHTAALVSIWRPRPQDFDDVNVGGLQNVIDAARASGIPRIVYTSSFLARPPAGATVPMAANDYQRTKVAARSVALAAAANGAPIVLLCPGVVYGPGPAREGNLVGRLLSDHRGGRLPGLVGADRLWSFAFVDGVARAHVAALTAGVAGAEYALGGENAPPMRLFEILRAWRGTRLPRRIPYPVAAAIGGIEELRARLTGHSPLLTRGVVDIFRQDWPLDSGPARNALGYDPIPLDRGLQMTVEAEGDFDATLAARTGPTAGK